MPAITFVNEDETTIETNADIGGTLMEAALEAEVPGIPAVCGGACSCATCHVHLDKDWYERLGEPDFTEKSILEFSQHKSPYSRLSCQLIVTEDMDGMVLHVPPSDE